jgi:hypothetical protein
VTEWDAAEDRNNRERTNRARQAAEELFKPIHHAEAGSPESPPSDTLSTEQPARRQPRIFTLPPRVSAGAQAEPPTEPKPRRRKPAVRRPTGTVPPSQIGRVRALTSYGMTPAQVAELYDVTVGEIERIISAPAYSGKSR